MSLPMTLGPVTGVVGEVYRAAKDWRGDPKQNVHVGTIAGIIFGGRSARLNDGREESADTTGQIGCPRDAVKVQPGDRIVIDGVVYTVVGPRMFDYPSNLTGEELGLYWVSVRAAV